MIYIGIDDTDILGSRGTGNLARQIAADLAEDFTILGVTRHQLFVDPRIPYTSHNSSATIGVHSNEPVDLDVLFQRVKDLMLADFQPGSDPGLCLAISPISQEIVEFGLQVKKQVVTQEQARSLARSNRMLLAGLGGTEDGVIGALAAVGLASYGDDGRYLLIGNIRDLTGPQTIPAILSNGISAVKTLNGANVEQGLVIADKLRPARRGGQAIAYVDWSGEYWQPLKLD